MSSVSREYAINAIDATDNFLTRNSNNLNTFGAINILFCLKPGDKSFCLVWISTEDSVLLKFSLENILHIMADTITTNILNNTMQCVRYE